jgi:hypothetical protein
MPLWGNNDAANSKPLLPVERQVREVTTLTTASANAAGDSVIKVTAAANTINALGIVGSYVYSFDVNTASTAAVSRLLDGTIIDQNDIAFLKSNNTVASIDTANSKITLTNNLMATLNTGSLLYFANTLVFNSNVHSNIFGDTILVTATRTANANNTLANIGSLNQGWNHIRKKTNNDGTIRFIKETLIALANATASNTTSGNTTSGGQIVSGL